METTIKKQENRYLMLIGVLSVAVPVLVAILLFTPSELDFAGDWVYFLPHLNAVINSATSLLLLAGVIFIKNKQIQYHQTAMTSAFVLGALFLVSYVIYHASAPSTSFGGEGSIRYVYYFLLISHIILAAIVVPFVLLAFFFAWTKKFDRHRKIVKYTFPIWFYVSVTGVIVYLMISPYYNF